MLEYSPRHQSISERNELGGCLSYFLGFLIYVGAMALLVGLIALVNHDSYTKEEYDEAVYEAYEKGFEDGRRQEYEDESDSWYESGYYDGHYDGYGEGYDDGYRDGHKDGFNLAYTP